MESFESWEDFEQEVDKDDLPVYVTVDECLYCLKDRYLKDLYIGGKG